MAKIGTAHVEVKPVLNQEALDTIGKAIEDAVAAGVERGLNRHTARTGSPARTGKAVG